MLSIYPRIFCDLIRRRRFATNCHFFDASRMGLFLAKITGWTTGTKIRELIFTRADVKDESDLPISLRINQDILQIQKNITNGQVFQEPEGKDAERPRLLMFLAKQLAPANPTVRHTLRRALALIYVSKWENRN